MPKTILVADDDALVLESLVEVLKGSGFEVATATSADEAAAALSGRPVDLVLSDYRMPGASGLELAARLKALEPGLPVVLMSGLQVNHVQAYLNGAQEVLAKPFTSEQLLGTIRACLK